VNPRWDWAACLNARQQRLLGVPKEVEHDLFELRAVSEDEGQPGIEIHTARDAGCLQRVAPSAYDVSNDVVDVRRDASLAISAANHCEQIANNVRRPQRFVVDRLERRSVIWIERPLQQQLRKSNDGGERIIQLVCDSRQRRAYACHSLGAPEQLVAALTFGHVVDDSFERCDPTRAVDVSKHCNAHRDWASIASLPTTGAPLGESTDAWILEQCVAVDRIQKKLINEAEPNQIQRIGVAKYRRKRGARVDEVAVGRRLESSISRPKKQGMIAIERGDFVLVQFVWAGESHRSGDRDVSRSCSLNRYLVMTYADRCGDVQGAEAAVMIPLRPPHLTNRSISELRF
jgi:hypothetical protein